MLPDKSKVPLLYALLVLQLGKGLVENVALWHKHGLVHRDLSVSNVGLADDGDVLIWDFATMASVSATHGPREPGRWTGTWLYMAISVQQGGAWTLSSELECILYILIGLSLEDGAVHWRKSWPGDSDAKIAAMMDARTFDAKVKVQSSLHFVVCMISQLEDPMPCQNRSSIEAGVATDLAAKGSSPVDDD